MVSLRPSEPNSSFANVSPDTSLRHLALCGVATVLVLGLIVAAIWVAVAAAFENARFTAASRQILDVLAMARFYEGGRNLPPGSDVLKSLATASLVAGSRMEGGRAVVPNPWDKALTATVLPDGGVEIATELPAPGCVHVARFFVVRAQDLGLVKAEVRKGTGERNEVTPSGLSPLKAESALQRLCSAEGAVKLALGFRRSGP